MLLLIAPLDNRAEKDVLQLKERLIIKFLKPKDNKNYRILFQNTFADFLAISFFKTILHLKTLEQYNLCWFDHFVKVEQNSI